ncbi:tyrosinase family protein [Streptomyces sp. NPDC091204]|uniref:tyrosinase family protein n=1 Tax=Streptomyces sp. NPDC091204 TaxID=3155299 RepID=UPI003427DD6D
MNIRKNIYSLTPQELADFQAALNTAKSDGSYDDFIHRHHHAMMAATPMSGETPDWNRRNVAHRGPAFLPWHRYFCRELELLLQTKKANVTLPYWDWAADSTNPAAAGLWNTNAAAGPVYVGGDGDGPNGEVTTGPFTGWTGLIEGPGGGLVPRPGGIIRQLGRPGSSPNFPTTAQVVDLIDNWTVYDTSPWDLGVTGSFRNRLEGWNRVAGESGSQLHNRVHTWMGGDMGPGTSPNDPVFYLHHCNVDRLWAKWQHTHPTAPYLPASGGPAGHNLADQMQHLVTADATPTRSLDYRRTLGFIYDTDPPLVETASLTVNFHDVPTLETTWQAATFRVRAGGPVRLEIVPGSGPAAPYSLTALGGAVTHTPVVDSAPFDLVRIWFSFTGTAVPGAAANGTVRIRCVETGEVFDFVLTASTVERPTSGVVFSLDKSGSMSQPAGTGPTRMQVLHEAASRCVELIRDSSGAGMVSFDQDAHAGVKLAPFGPGLAQRADVLAAITALTPGGNTSIGDGVEAAHQALTANGSAFTKRAIVVLTDGLENEPKFLDEVTGLIDARTFAIGLGSTQQVSASALTKLTNGTGGYLLLTDTLGTDTDSYFRLSKYFQQILVSATNDSVVTDPSGFIAASELVRVPFELNETDIEATVTLLVDVPAVELALETPSGEVITEADLRALGATVERGTNMTFCRFGLPLPVGAGAHGGTWQVQLRANEDALANEIATLKAAARENPSLRTDLERLIAHGPRYSVSVTSWSDLRFGARVTQSGMEPGATLRFDATLTEYGLPVDHRAKVVADVWRPDGVLMRVPLREELPGAFTGDITAAMGGVWRARVQARGHTFRMTRFTREQQLSAAVLVGGDRPPERPEPGYEEIVNR